MKANYFQCFHTRKYALAHLKSVWPTLVDSLKTFLNTNCFYFYAVHQMFKSHILLQLWMTFPSTVCTFECNLSLILLVIVPPCTLSFPSLFYHAPCPFPPCCTMHVVLFLVGLPCKLSLSSRWFHPDPCHFPQVSSHLLFSLLSHPWHGAGTPGFVFQGHISSIQKWFVMGPAFSQLNHTLRGGSQCRVVDQTCKVCESTNRWLCTMRV